MWMGIGRRTKYRLFVRQLDSARLRCIIRYMTKKQLTKIAKSTKPGIRPNVNSLPPYERTQVALIRERYIAERARAKR